MLSAAFIFALSLAGQARAQAACSSFAVPELPGVVFQEALDADFTKLLPTQDVAEALSNMNLSISNFNVGSTPVVHTFFPSNVAIGNNGSLELTVKSYAGSGPVSSAEISTTAEFTYCSARTVMKTSSVPGVCVGSFFYQSDQQEIDWEILSSTATEGNEYLDAGVWATNQAVQAGSPVTDAVIPLNGSDPTTNFIGYRIDWVPGATMFYLNGQLQRKFTSNVPTKAGPWIINAWSSGEKYWSAGPPTEDSITEIRSFTLYYGYSEGETADCVAPLYYNSASPTETASASSIPISSAGNLPLSFTFNPILPTNPSGYKGKVPTLSV